MKEFEGVYNVAACSFSEVEQLIIHIKTKAENVKTYRDEGSGWVKTAEAEEHLLTVIACLNAIKTFGIPSLNQILAMKKGKETTMTEEFLFKSEACKQIQVSINKPFLTDFQCRTYELELITSEKSSFSSHSLK